MYNQENMKKKMELPKVEVIRLDMVDIITASEPDLTPDNHEMIV